MDKDVVEALRYFNSSDGPHISLMTLSIYCGVTKSAMRDYVRGLYKPNPTTRKQLEQGLSELVKEMRQEWPY